MSSTTSEISGGGAATTASSLSSSARSLTEFSDSHSLRLGLDLVAAARRTLSLLRAVAGSPWLHHAPTCCESVRRYTELWMPLVSDLSMGPTAPVILPPLDIEWVWFCHSLNPVRYAEYCESKFSRLVGKPLIFNVENEEYALLRCSEIWVKRYPDEPFENDFVGSESESESSPVDPSVMEELTRRRHLYGMFSEPYRSEAMYLIAARQRYRGFISVLPRKSGGPGRSCFVPASDILLMLLTHQSYPTVYAEDMKDVESDTRKAVSVCENVTRNEAEATKNLWEATFDQPYEKAGGDINFNIDGITRFKPRICWEVSDIDVNGKYKSMLPRFLLEVCVFTRLEPETTALQGKNSDFLRLRVARCHRELKLDRAVSSFSNQTWQKAWHFYGEFGTKGVKIDLCRLGGHCCQSKTVKESIAFHWNDALRAPSLTLQSQLGRRVKIAASITPPVQASYLLKCVPDRVTDDSGAMISDVILRMNQYRPQEGRWISRTVLDHAGRECFVIRIRVGGGFWRRGGEAPSTVKREDRIIEIRQGSWSYVAGSIGRAPEKVVGMATPKEPTEQWNAAWEFSSGDKLTVQQESSTSAPRFELLTTDSDSTVKLLRGRKMQYQVKNEEKEEDDAGFLTLVRFTEDYPDGRATALLNWKLLAVEFIPEEDAVLLLLLCVAILRSVSEMKKEDLGRLLVRRRLKEARHGSRDWGSVVLNPPLCSVSSSSPYVQPWHLNAKAVIVSENANRNASPAGFGYSPEEGSDQFYKIGIFS